MRAKKRFIINTDRDEIYLILLLFTVMIVLGGVNRVCVPSGTSLFIFLKEIEFIFLVGVIIALHSGFESQGGNRWGVSWELTKNTALKQNILKEDEDIKMVVNYGIGGGRFAIRFDVLTDRRVLRWKKYFGITEEIDFSAVKSYRYKTSLMVMTLKFETEQGIQAFEIVMIKPMQTEMAPILEKLMHEKGIPKNDNL